jgi:hypothetical protein
MGLLARVGVSGEREHAWYLTADGAGVAAAGGERRPYRMTPQQAAGPLQAHTLATNEVGLVFVRAARMYGDECGPASWRNETAHQLGGARGEAVIADAVLEYTVWDDDADDPRTYLCRFIEVDRSTTPVRTLAHKLESYARLRLHTFPYPVFPEVAVVMCGRDERALERRAADLCALVLSSATLGRSDVVIAITSLARLSGEGPHEAIWRRPGYDHLVDLRGAVLEDVVTGS